MEYQDALFPEDRKKLQQSFVYGTTEFKQAYSRYIASPQWRKLCKQIKARANGRCESCDKAHPRMEVHHDTYERFQNERLTDLRYLCKPCHDRADWEREQENHRKFLEAGETARYESGFATYMTKKYGENYYMHDMHGFHEEYSEWLQEKYESGGDDY